MLLAAQIQARQVLSSKNTGKSICHRAAQAQAFPQNSMDKARETQPMMKQNIIAGLLLFCLSITLGPYMMRSLPNEESQVAARTELREAFAELRAAQDALEGDNVEQVADIANAAARAARAHVNNEFAGFRADNIAFTHAHGNLQGMLNILIGLFLGRLAVHALARQIISWGFIAGAWVMSGSLFLGNMMGQFWALQYMIWGGGILIVSLIGLTLAVIIRGFREAS